MRCVEEALSDTITGQVLILSLKTVPRNRVLSKVYAGSITKPRMGVPAVERTRLTPGFVFFNHMPYQYANDSSRLASSLVYRVQCTFTSLSTTNMPLSQLHPLQLDPQTGEPFLRLPAPFEAIIITPPRSSDVSSFVDTLNDVDVSRWLFSAAHPYTEKDAALKLARTVDGYEKVMKELKDAETGFPDGPLQFVGGCPVSCIREIQEDGSQVYIGDIKVARNRFLHLGDGELQKKTMAANEALPVGDENILWSIGGK